MLCWIRARCSAVGMMQPANPVTRLKRKTTVLRRPLGPEPAGALHTDARLGPGLLGTCAEKEPGERQGSMASIQQLSECRQPRDRQLCLRGVWCPPGTSKLQRGGNCAVGEGGKLLVLLNLDSFLQRRKMVQRIWGGTLPVFSHLSTRPRRCQNN